MWQKLLTTAAVIGGLWGLVLLGDTWINPSEAEGLSRRIERWTFWCSTITSLVFGYTSFEVLYRDSSATRIARLPVHTPSFFWLMVFRVYLRHLPLILLPACTGICLLESGQLAAYAVGVINTLSVLLWGLSIAIWVHLLAGASLLSGETLFKGLLSGAAAPPETAFLYYSPAAALAGALSVGILAELSVNTGVSKGIWGPFYITALLLSAGALWCLRQARAIFVAHHHQIRARFSDAEVLPPWREGDLPRTYTGESIGQLMPESLRPLWQRTLIMYRRRFRVVIPLNVLTCLAIILYGNAIDVADEAALRRLILSAIAVGVLTMLPVLRVAGPELGARFDTRALPIDGRNERFVIWVLAATEWIPLCLSTAIAALLGGFGIQAVWAASAVIVGFVLTHLVAIPWALASSPRVGVVSAVVKGSALLVLGAIAMFARTQGY